MKNNTLWFNKMKYNRYMKMDKYFYVGKRRLFINGESMESDEDAILPIHKISLDRIQIQDDKSFLKELVEEFNMWTPVVDGPKIFGWVLFDSRINKFVARTYKEHQRVFEISGFDEHGYSMDLNYKELFKIIVEKTYQNSYNRANYEPFIEWPKVWEVLPKKYYYREMMDSYDLDQEYSESVSDRSSVTSECYRMLLDAIFEDDEE